MKFFKLELNLGHVLSIIAMVGSLLGIWRAMEMKAVETRKDVEFLQRRMDTFESNQIKIIDKLEGLQVNQAKVAAILDGKKLIDKP